MRQTTTLRHSGDLPLLQRAELRDDGLAGWPTGGPVATLVFDADDFRDLGERLGDESGDRVLVALADRLQERLCPCGVTTHLDLSRRGIRCEGLSAEDHVADEVVQALVLPLLVGDQLVAVQARLEVDAVRVVGRAS